MEKRIIANFLLGLVCCFLVGSFLIQLVPFIIGADRGLIVLSGSMEPTFYPGDIILIKHVAPEEIKVGDIITINSTERPIYTHRVINITWSDGCPIFQTKGDANEDPDNIKATYDEVLGKVILIYPVHIVYSLQGYFFFVFLPACLLVIKQLYLVVQYLAPPSRRQVVRRSGISWKIRRIFGFRGKITRRRPKKPKEVLDLTTIFLLLIILAATMRVAITRIFISEDVPTFTLTHSLFGFILFYVREICSFTETLKLIFCILIW